MTIENINNMLKKLSIHLENLSGAEKEKLINSLNFAIDSDTIQIGVNPQQTKELSFDKLNDLLEKLNKNV